MGGGGRKAGVWSNLPFSDPFRSINGFTVRRFHSILLTRVRKDNLPVGVMGEFLNLAEMNTLKPMGRYLPPFLIWILVMMSGVVLGGELPRDTVLYLGANGRLVPEERALFKKEVVTTKRSRMEETSWKKVSGRWEKTATLKIHALKGDTWEISQGSGRKEGILLRQYLPAGEGKWQFLEQVGGKLMRKGFTLSRFPLLFDGEVTDYYPNGKTRSVAHYRQNELTGNLNWLENGNKYIDSVFYNADEEPMLTGGNLLLHQHMKKALEESGLDLTALMGNMVLGFVVMETGDLAGVRVIEGFNPRLNEVAVTALRSLGLKWQPAQLNGRPVRYFQLFPINFIYKEANFQSLDFDGWMIHYNKY